MQDVLPSKIIIHACGHERGYSLFDWRLKDGGAYMLSQSVCPTCLHADDNDKAIAQGRADGLTDLQGSERQVAWAASIRQAGLAEIDGKYGELATRLADRLITLGDIDEIYIADCLQEVRKVRTSYASETSATWWIDNQHLIGERCLSAATVNLPALRAANNARLGLPHPDEIARAQAEAKAARQAALLAGREAEQDRWTAQQIESARWRAIHDPYIDALLPLIGGGWKVVAQGECGGDAPRDVIATLRADKIDYHSLSDRLICQTPKECIKDRMALKSLFRAISRESRFTIMYVDG